MQRNKNMIRKEAFKKVINQRGIHHRLSLTSTAVRALRSRLKADTLSAEKQKEILLAYGATLKQEELWEVE